MDDVYSRVGGGRRIDGRAGRGIWGEGRAEGRAEGRRAMERD